MRTTTRKFPLNKNFKSQLYVADWKKDGYVILHSFSLNTETELSNKKFGYIGKGKTDIKSKWSSIKTEKKSGKNKNIFQTHKLFNSP